MQALKFEDLTIEQKLGMVSCGLISSAFGNRTDETDERALEMIRNHSLGAIWVHPMAKDFDEIMRKIKEAADYPILIFTDAESGLAPHRIGYQNSLGMADDEEYAYVFGKVTAITARKMGYNVVCNPILDVCKGKDLCGNNVRCIGSDKECIAKLAAAMARGMHDGGVLTVGKHYPSATSNELVDSHMAETWGVETAEELLNNNLYPYLEMMKEDLLDGIMTSHKTMANIDPERPTTLSRKVIDVIRNAGFNGFAITDAMNMMGVVAKFGNSDSKGMAIEAGNDLSLNWTIDSREGYEAICEAYKKGILSDAALDAAVKRVLQAQEKILQLAVDAEIAEEDIQKLDELNTACIYARADEGVDIALDKNAKHYFIVLTENDWKDGAPDVVTFFSQWYNPVTIREKLLTLFPNSTVAMLPQYPSGSRNFEVITESVDYDDIVFVTFQEIQAFIGPECLTSRVIALADSFQRTNRVSAIVHIGNPYVLEDLPHIPRVIVGSPSGKCVMACMDVLAGERKANGKLTYDVNIK